MTGTVLSVDSKFATIELAEGVEGMIRASDLSLDQVDDARTMLKEGEELEALVVGVDRKRRAVVETGRINDEQNVHTGRDHVG